MGPNPKMIEKRKLKVYEKLLCNRIEKIGLQNLEEMAKKDPTYLPHLDCLAEIIAMKIESSLN